MDYVIIVNDNGELKTISAAELERGWSEKQKAGMQGLINLILDTRSQLEEILQETALHPDDGELPEYGGN